jgi:20S proteasome alpha/beta subunit
MTWIQDHPTVQTARIGGLIVAQCIAIGEREFAAHLLANGWEHSRLGIFETAEEARRAVEQAVERELAAVRAS